VRTSSRGMYQRGGSPASNSTFALLVSATTSPPTETRTCREVSRTSMRE
jgi:hypothetical protein